MTDKESSWCVWAGHSGPGSDGPAQDGAHESRLSLPWTKGCGREGLGCDSEATAVGFLQAPPAPSVPGSASPCGVEAGVLTSWAGHGEGPANLGVVQSSLAAPFLKTQIAAALIEPLLDCSWAQGSAHFMSFQPHSRPISWPHQFHFTAEETGLYVLSNLPKATQVANEQAGFEHVADSGA